jgi:hypothetical protein
MLGHRELVVRVLKELLDVHLVLNPIRGQKDMWGNTYLIFGVLDLYVPVLIIPI